MAKKAWRTEVCIVGGGPAGLVLANLLAERGIEVIVLEKNENFEREFRGEVLQPRFVHAARQVGIYEELEGAPHERFDRIDLYYSGEQILSMPMSKIDPDVPFVTWMTQPTMLGALHKRAQKSPSYSMWFGARVTQLLRDGDRIAGLECERGGSSEVIRCNLVVGADGRYSLVRRLAAFATEYDSYRFDVMWFQIPRPSDYDYGGNFFFSPKLNCLVLPKHPDLLQCGVLVAPGAVREYLRRGPKHIAASLRQLHPIFHEFADGLKSFDHFNILQARIHYVETWATEGCLLIGDAAHTCSPAGAIGVTIATETAIVAAGVIAKAHRTCRLEKAEALHDVQRLRNDEVRQVHRIQERAASLAFLGNPVTRRLFPHVVMLGARTGLAPLVASRLVTRSKPLPFLED